MEHPPPHLRGLDTSAPQPLVPGLRFWPEDALEQKRAIVDLVGQRFRPLAVERFMLCGFGDLLRAMARHRTHAGVQEMGCVTMRNMSSTNEAARHLAVSGAIEAGLGAMRNHPTAAAVQAEACGLLRNLAIDPLKRATLAGAGAISAVLAALRTHLDAEKVVEQAYGALRNLFNVVEQACGALRNLAADSANKECILAEAGVNAILRGMEKHPLAVQLQEEGLAALKNLAGQRDRDALIAALVQSARPGENLLKLIKRNALPPPRPRQDGSNPPGHNEALLPGPFAKLPYRRSDDPVGP
ncbi:hypothetical protein T484DRAFT_1896687, partial [Baffinella frigidus]